ncbi:hypothetical protein ACOSQ4_031600 [Xanthoceras sorbifolium]
MQMSLVMPNLINVLHNNRGHTNRLAVVNENRDLLVNRVHLQKKKALVPQLLVSSPSLAAAHGGPKHLSKPLLFFPKQLLEPLYFSSSSSSSQLQLSLSLFAVPVPPQKLLRDPF